MPVKNVELMYMEIRKISATASLSASLSYYCTIFSVPVFAETKQVQYHPFCYVSVV